MRTLFSEYRSGIVSLHHLMDLLQVVLLEVMPGAEIARAGACWWRGYGIRNYKNLATGLYFCQIYTGQPSVLLMEEFTGFVEPPYPWRVDLDLLQTDFFARDVNGQKTMIKNFFGEAVKEALEWQDSAKRHSIVPRRLWAGKKDYETTAQLTSPQKLFQVGRDYVLALGLQNNLLGKLKEIIEAQAKDLGMAKPFIKYNTNGWKYRGLWMKNRKDEPESVEPAGPFPYHFKINLYDHPGFLRFVSDEQESYLDLEKTYYFSLDDKSKEKTLVEFVQPIIHTILIQP